MLLLPLISAAVLAVHVPVPPLKTLNVGFPVSGMAFSPVDGTLLATVTSDPESPLILWNVTTLGTIKTATDVKRCHSASIAFSPDGSLLAAGDCVASEITLWNIPSCTANRTLDSGTSKPIHGLAFSPDGKFLASIDGELAFKLWDLNSNKQIWEVSSIDGASFSGAIAFSPNGKQVVAGMLDDRTISILDILKRTGAIVVHELKSDVRDVAFSPDGTRFASADGAGYVRLWDSTTFTESDTPGHKHTFSAHWVRYSPDGKLLLSAGVSLQVYNASSGEKIHTLKPDVPLGFASVSGLSPDGTLFAMRSREDKTVKLWSVASLVQQAADSAAAKPRKPNLESRRRLLRRNSKYENALDILREAGPGALRKVAGADGGI